MKNIGLTIIFSLFLIQTTKADQLEKYYSEINNAELSITAHDYKMAINYYDTAFKNKQEPFARDIYNQTICYIRNNDFREAITNCFALAEKGTGADFFQNNIVFSPLRQQSQWRQLLKTAELKKAALDHKNKVLNKKLNTLYHTDQTAHILLRSMTAQNEDSITHYVKNVDDSLSGILMDIFDHNGFISEFNWGVTLNENFEIKNMPDFYLIMLHNFQGIQRHDSLFAPVLRKAVLNGKIKPEIYAFMLDNNCKDFKTFNGTVMMYVFYQGKLYVQKYCDSLEIKKQINHQRKSLMLPVLDDYLKKIEFNLNEPGNKFLIYAPCSKIGSIRDNTSEQAFLKGLKLIRSKF